MRQYMYNATRLPLNNGPVCKKNKKIKFDSFQFQLTLVLIENKKLKTYQRHILRALSSSSFLLDSVWNRFSIIFFLCVEHTSVYMFIYRHNHLFWLECVDSHSCF